MAIDNLLTRIIAQIGKSEAENHLVSHYAPPSRDDVLHDGLVGSGKTLGGILGTTAGYLGGQAVGGPGAAFTGSVLLEPPGTPAGAWAAHGAYREGQLIGNIPQYFAQPASSPLVPGGLPGMLLDYLRSNPGN